MLSLLKMACAVWIAKLQKCIHPSKKLIIFSETFMPEFLCVPHMCDSVPFIRAMPVWDWCLLAAAAIVADGNECAL